MNIKPVSENIFSKKAYAWDNTVAALNVWCNTKVTEESPLLFQNTEEH